MLICLGRYTAQESRIGSRNKARTRWLLEMSCAESFQFVRLVSLASLAIVALTAIFLTTTSAAELDHPDGDSVQRFDLSGLRNH